MQSPGRLQGPLGTSFAQTGHAMRLLESVAVAVQQQEPVLLVGETGTGKTTAVQQLASRVRAGILCNHVWLQNTLLLHGRLPGC